jgi:hypothetical protein
MLKQLNKRKSIQLDAYQLLKDDIVNYKKLNDYQKLYIEHLTEEQKVEIILLYENVMNSLIESMYTKI